MLSQVWVCCPDLWSFGRKMRAQSLQIACHSLHSATCRAKGRRWRQVIFHDLWQPPVERWWLYHRLSAIMTSQKAFLPLKRGRASDIIKRLSHEKRKVKAFWLRKKNILITRAMTDKIVGGCVRTSFTGRTEAGIILGWKRASIWRLWGSLGRQASTLAPFVGTLAQSTAKMSAPSKSRSSARGDEGYFEWREAMERRQFGSERQMQALLQETTRLREENVVLRIQASSSGPPRDQRSRG